jgi:hypothetical protein|tara:strand:- start:1506 stop:1916 length:411 start_codon:yes stop_codon:yes gene_type:complete
MKKIKLTIAGLLLAGFSYSQAQDTICHSIAGKIHFEFDYYESKITKKSKTVFLEDTEITIDSSEYLVLDLYDDCKCVKDKNFITKRKIIVYFRDGKIKSYVNNSKDDVLNFDGKEVKKIIIKKPKLKKLNNKYEKV